jgi:hypothetical protein
MSYAPSTSYGSTSRRPLPRPPGQSVSETVPGLSIDMRNNTQSDYGPSRSADLYQPRFPSPSSGPPPPFVPSPSRHPIVLSPERIPIELPPATPSTPSSGSIRHRTHRQSVQSLTSSISPARSPASFNTLDPPPWAVTHPEDGISRGGTVLPETQLIRVDINQDPGRTVSSNLGAFDLCMNKGDPQTIPSYGRGEQVEGYIDLKVFDHIAEIEVTVCKIFSI